MTYVKNLLGVKVALQCTSPLFMKVSRNTPVTCDKSFTQRITCRHTSPLFIKASRMFLVTFEMNYSGARVIFRGKSPLYIKVLIIKPGTFAMSHLSRTLSLRSTTPLENQGSMYHSVILWEFLCKIVSTVKSYFFLPLIVALNVEGTV